MHKPAEIAVAAELEVPGAGRIEATAKRLYRDAQVGRCVNSVTHDVNNYLGAIMAYGELIALDNQLNPESTRMMNEIIQAVRKSTVLLSTLTTIARPDRSERRKLSLVDVARFVEGVVALRHYDLQCGRFEFEHVTEGAAGSAAVDEANMSRALLCLLANAIEACNEGGRKRIRLTVRGEADSVAFEVCDFGPPLPFDVTSRMFEPWFTTKGPEHAGLGLAIASEIARNHGGSLRYDSGSGFILTIPRNAST